MISDCKWESDVLKLKVGRVDDGKIPSQVEMRNFDYVTAKVRIGQINTVRDLEDSGFRYCGTLQEFMYRGPAFMKSPNTNLVVRLATNNDIRELQLIGRESFYYDRFHSDPFITGDDADKIYESWIKNEVDGTFGSATFIASYRGDTLGFTCCRVSDGVLGNIDLTAVATKAYLKYRLSEVSDVLIRAAIGFFKLRDIDSIVTGTQLDNIPSINSLTRNGFVPKRNYINLSWRKP